MLRPDGNAVTDRTAQSLLHGVFVALFQVQVTVFFIALKDSFAFQKPSHAVADRMHQLRQFLPIRCIGTMKATFTPGCGGVNTIQKQHVKVNIEVQRTAKTLDQRHRTSLRGFSSESRLLNEMG